MIGILDYGSLITYEIFDKGLDGIQYLVDHIDAGVSLVLTEIYTQAILKKVGNVPNLGQTRRLIAQRKRIIS